jgi:ATP-dependent Clp protease protease subunit
MKAQTICAPIVMTARTQRPKGAPEYRMVAKGGRGEIYLYGIIGVSSDSFFGVDGVTAKQFADDLKKLGNVTTIDLRINSDGGVVDDARAMYNLLTQHPAEVRTHIDSLAASAASFVAMAGKSIEIAEGGFVMIHNARGGAWGTADELRSRASVMDGYNDAIINTYAARTGNSAAQLKKWMDAETWFTAEEAVQFKFADSVSQNMRAVAAISDARRFQNLPTALLPKRAAAVARIAALRRK